MTLDLKKFAALQRASKESFVQQKKLVKQVMLGQKIPCSTCNQPLMLTTPEQDETSGIRCSMGCTDIQLDFT